MIPKTIHYCWFGGNPLPESVRKCIESWRKHCPDYEIIQWNESNYDVKTIPYIEQAYKQKKYAFVSDYARLDIIYSFGGVYLDTDVELLKSLDPLLEEECFMGLESPGRVATGLGFGAISKNKIIKENMEEYQKLKNESNLLICVEVTSQLLIRHGLDFENKIQNLNGVTVYPTEYFCPLSMESKKLSITKNTYSIHHYDSSWYSDNTFVKLINKKALPVKIKIKRNINKIFGEGAYQKIKKKFTKG